MAKLRVVVVGGGAAGFFGAIACAEANPDAEVVLLEAGQQVLSKVRISGGGRCNVTHACFEPASLVQHYPRGGKALRGAFTRFQPRNTVDWFTQRGVKLKTEADGRMFPVTDDSETIVHCLIQAAKTAGVQIQSGTPVVKVVQSENRFTLTLKSGESITADRLLLATGSSPQGHRFAKTLGHSIVPPVPSLFTFTVPDAQLRELAGIAIEPAQAKLIVPNEKPLEQTGAILITHWGLSGPAILKLSAWGARLLHDRRYQATLQVNWLPQKNAEQVRQTLHQMKTDHGKRSIASDIGFALPRRLWQYMVARSGIAEGDRWAGLSKSAMNRLIQELTQGQFTIQGKGVFKDEFVTCGGVSLKEVDFKTMASRHCPGLYFAGEILDIDGVTGGFNFQSAWTTGWLAGQAMATNSLG
ncbi:BaiN/RdsA family NAD(P)/FAD-dependent oxidoreductase [Egbenema bharatensis]|uniref:NAD(P)/FAD-dependent oxidoreductase n=1 Tax=Egbenema bharatensis TaxID=3463334 RepID=UPI003A894EC2